MTLIFGNISAYHTAKRFGINIGKLISEIEIKVKEI